MALIFLGTTIVILVAMVLDFLELKLKVKVVFKKVSFLVHHNCGICEEEKIQGPEVKTTVS